MERAIIERAERAIKEGVFPGCVIGTVRKTGERMVVPVGHFTYEEISARVNENTIYDVASVTKSIPATSILLGLIDEGVVALDDPVVKYIPEFGNHPGKESVLIKHLLTYTLDIKGVPPMASFKTKTADEIIDIVLKAPLTREPGEKLLYSNTTALIIGVLIRNITGRDIDGLADERFFEPLKMDHTTFHPERFSREEIAPTEFDEWRGRLIHGEVHDESTYILNQKFITGISGLFSTVPNILNFMEMLINGGRMNGREYFSEKIIREMGTNQLTGTNESSGLGWELNQPRFMGKHAPELFGKTGFTGCLVLCSLEENIGMAFLSNTIHPKRKIDPGSINRGRKDIADIVFSN
ncbi:MAG: serine hydrolase [Minisyncoccia bacterium]